VPVCFELAAVLLYPFSHEAKRSARQRAGDHLTGCNLDPAAAPPYLA
jgi:hypothetical protein